LLSAYVKFNFELWLRWGAPCLAVIGIFLPALSASAPLLAPQSWSVFDVCAAALHAAPSGGGQNQQQISLHDLLKHVEDVRSQLARHQGGGMPLEFKLALLTPAILIIAAFAALLMLVFSFARWWRSSAITAAVGVIASAYVISAAWLLTRAVQREVGTALERARHSFHLHALGELGASFADQLGLHAEAALYLMLFAFITVLVVPRPQPKPQAPAAPHLTNEA
jgi:hypothetical protein